MGVHLKLSLFSEAASKASTISNCGERSRKQSEKTVRNDQEIASVVPPL